MIIYYFVFFSKPFKRKEHTGNMMSSYFYKVLLTMFNLTQTLKTCSLHWDGLKTQIDMAVLTFKKEKYKEKYCIIVTCKHVFV